MTILIKPGQCFQDVPLHAKESTHQIRYKAIFIVGNQRYLILDVNILMSITLLG